MTLATWAAQCTAVPLVDVGDDLLAPARLDVDVDVGRTVALGERNRSNNNPRATGSARVMPSAKQTAELAAEPRPWQ